MYPYEQRKFSIIKWLLALSNTILFLLGGVFVCSAQSIVTEAHLRKGVEHLKNDTLPIEIEELTEIINTPYSEYSPILFSDSTFFFSSLRPVSDEDNAQYFNTFWATRIYQSQLTISGYAEPEALPRTINDDRYYNCNFTFSHDRTMIIFSRCMRGSGEELQCTLWQSDYDKGKWSKAKMLHKKINLPGSTTTQPCWVDYDEYSVLYFVSNRPNGYGEMDIWYSLYKNQRFEDPINVGSQINSSDNEITPFYDSRTHTLYFSTDNPHKTLGGYDIFYAQGALSQWRNVTNAGIPLNSEANDFYFTKNSNDEGGYFVSNRPHSHDDDPDTCCSSIYSYRMIYQEDSSNNEVDTVTIVDTIFKEVTQLLPLVLYFHNDEPDPKSTLATTTKNYQQLLANYIAMKGKYKQEYSGGLTGAAAEEAERTIEQFFTDSIAGGFKKLERFCQQLERDLSSGRWVEIEVCGYASPLHKAQYNYILSSRRIGSFINYLYEYRGGILKTYINDGKLRIRSTPTGSTMAKKGVSENPNDRRNSIYSIAASRERKITITRYEIIKE